MGKKPKIKALKNDKAVFIEFDSEEWKDYENFDYCDAALLIFEFIKEQEQEKSQCTLSQRLSGLSL